MLATLLLLAAGPVTPNTSAPPAWTSTTATTVGPWTVELLGLGADKQVGVVRGDLLVVVVGHDVYALPRGAPAALLRTFRTDVELDGADVHGDGAFWQVHDAPLRLDPVPSPPAPVPATSGAWGCTGDAATCAWFDDEGLVVADAQGQRDVSTRVGGRVLVSPDGGFVASEGFVYDVKGGSVVVDDHGRARRYASFDAADEAAAKAFEARAAADEARGDVLRGDASIAWTSGSCTFVPQRWLSASTVEVHYELVVDGIGEYPPCPARPLRFVLDLKTLKRKALPNPVVVDDGWRALPCGWEHRKGALDTACHSELEAGRKPRSPPRTPLPDALVVDSEHLVVFAPQARTFRWHRHGVDPSRDTKDVALDAGHEVVVPGAALVRFVTGDVVVTALPAAQPVQHITASLDDDWHLVETADGPALLRISAR